MEQQRLKFTIENISDFVDLFGQMFKLTQKEKDVLTAIIEAIHKYPYGYDLEFDTIIYWRGLKKEYKQYTMSKLGLTPKALSGYINRLKAKGALSKINGTPHQLFDGTSLNQKEILIQWKIPKSEKKQLIK